MVQDQPIHERAHNKPCKGTNNATPHTAKAREPWPQPPPEKRTTLHTQTHTIASHIACPDPHPRPGGGPSPPSSPWTVLHKHVDVPTQDTRSTKRSPGRLDRRQPSPAGQCSPWTQEQISNRVGQAKTPRVLQRTGETKICSIHNKTAPASSPAWDVGGKTSCLHHQAQHRTHPPTDAQAANTLMQ